MTIATDGYSRVEVFNKEDYMAGWIPEFESPRTVVGGAGSIPLNRDAWLPTIAVNAYPGRSTSYVMVIYVSTRNDATSNSNVRTYGAVWQEDGTVTAPVLIDSTNTTASMAVDSTLGRYNGSFPLSHYVGGFANAWGDQRGNPETLVYTSRSTY